MGRKSGATSRISSKMNAVNLPLIYGTAWKKEHTKDLVIKAVKMGFRGIDTACQPKHYHESGVGQALEELFKGAYKREDLFIQTKFTLLAGQDPLTTPYDKTADLSTQVAQSFEVSKTNLRTNYIDSLILHSPPSDFEDLQIVWRAMEKLVDKKEVGQIGISNIYDLQTLKDLYEMAVIKPRVVQNRFYEKSSYDVKIRSFCTLHDISYQSFWTLTANPHILKSTELIALAKKYNKNTIQIFFVYLSQIGITPLSGTKDILHMKSDLESFDIVLDKEEVEKLSSLFN